MAITLVSGNLNLYGDAGNFETDASGWGFGGSSAFSVVRSSEHKTKGLYSAKVTYTEAQPVGGLYNSRNVVVARVNVQSGKTYIAKAKVRTPSSAVLGNNTLAIRIGQMLGEFGLSDSEGIGTITNPVAITNTWTSIQWRFKLDGILGTPGFYKICVSVNGGTSFGGTGEGYLGGILFVDEFEIYEYVGTGDEGDPDPDPDPEPNPAAIDKVFHSRNPIVVIKTAGEDWEEDINHRLYTEVAVEDVADSDDFDTKIRLELPPDSSGKCAFYLQQAFRGVFAFNAPTKNQDTIVRLTDRVKRFKTLHGFLVGTETYPEAELEQSEVNLVLYGGISKEKWPGLNYFTTYMQENKKFLTWAPTDKYVDRLQEDYLNFWVYDEFASLKLQLKAYFDDDTTATEVVKTITGTFYGQLYQIPAGPINSGVLLIDPTKNVVKYELVLLNHSDEVITEVRTYHIVPTPHPLTRFFMFLNSLGSFEVLRFTGKAIETTDFTRDVIQKYLPHTYATLDGEFSVNSIQIQKKKSYSSGFIKDLKAKEWHQYLIDFLRSPVIYDVTNGKRSPVVITGSKHEQTDQDYTRFIQFDIKPAYDDEVYTPDSV
jgi:hypothetical protein